MTRICEDGEVEISRVRDDGLEVISGKRDGVDRTTWLGDVVCLTTKARDGMDPPTWIVEGVDPTLEDRVGAVN